jgi:hypothetical protein
MRIGRLLETVLNQQMKKIRPRGLFNKLIRGNKYE